MTVLSELVDAADPSLAPYAVAAPGEPRFGEIVEDPLRLFVLEAVYEGYLMHYGTPRAFRGMDEDLRLLAGDALYAVGLSRLAEAADLPAIAELADLISRSARAHAEGLPDRVEALWLTSARALAHDRLSERGQGAL